MKPEPAGEINPEPTASALRESEAMLRAFFDSPGLLCGIVEVVQDDLLQITHATVSKAQALRTVAAEMTVQREQVMAIGDNANDVGMLRWAGIGVAMANACPAALAAADFVTDSHDADGAANAIRRIILEGKIPKNVANAPRHRGKPKGRGE